MFEKDLTNFKVNANESKTIQFDRSFLDSAASYSRVAEKYYDDISHYTDRFSTNVFMTPPWQEIYTTDDERDQTFDDAIVVMRSLCVVQFPRIQTHTPAEGRRSGSGVFYDDESTRTQTFVEKTSHDASLKSYFS